MAPRLLVCLAIVALAAGRAEAAATGAGLFVGATPVPMVEASIALAVRLGVAHGVVKQRFHNERGAAIEAVYVFPLPTGASVEAMEVTVGGTTLGSAIARRADAAARYQDAVETGRAAALTEQERPGVFTQSIAPVPAGGDVEITLRWRAPLVRRDGTWELAHPLVVGPRYVPGRATGKPSVGGGVLPDTDRAPDASRVTPPIAGSAATPYHLAIALDDADAISSPSHPLAIARDGGGARITLDDARGDRELIVRWTSRRAAQVRAIAEPDGKGGAYVAVLVEAERGGAAPARAGRRWVLAIDRSPSLDGAAAAAARGVADALIARLHADEPVAVVAIGDAPRFAADHAAARRALVELPAAGADLTRGLAATLAALPRDPAPEVVLVTDGLVADDAAAIERAAAAGVRIHTIGVGGAPNRWLLDAIAARTGGAAAILTSIDDTAAVAGALLDGERGQPVTVDWRSPAVSDAEATSPRLAAGGATLLVATTAAGVPRHEVVVAIGSRKLRAPIVAAEGAELAATWAALRVQRLYAAGDRDGATRIALAHGVIAPTTALVAVAAAAGDPVRSTISVPVPVPVGTRRNGMITEQLDGATGEAEDENFVAAPPPPTGGTRAPVTAAEEPRDAGGGGDADGDATIAIDAAPASGSAYAPERLALDEASVLGRDVSRTVFVASLGLGARLDARAPAALASVGVYRRLPRFFAAGLRLDLGGAPTVDDPVTAAALLSLSSRALGPLRVDGGAGLGWDGEVGAAYQLGVFAGKHGVGVAFRLSGIAGTTTRATTAALGVEASF